MCLLLGGLYSLLSARGPDSLPCVTLRRVTTLRQVVFVFVFCFSKWLMREEGREGWRIKWEMQFLSSHTSVSGMTDGHFCSILLLSETDFGTVWETTREWKCLGSLGLLLRLRTTFPPNPTPACMQANFAAFAKLSWPHSVLFYCIIGTPWIFCLLPWYWAYRTGKEKSLYWTRFLRTKAEESRAALEEANSIHQK